MLKILSVIGTRPEAVKLAPVIRLLRQTRGIESRVCATAQHRQMLDQVLNLFDIRPDFDLNLMREDQSLGRLSAEILLHLDPILEQVDPDWVLAQGDTTTVAITALLCYFRQVRFGHVEAGLRTHDKWQPFPEEINSRVAAVAADLHFAPTELSKKNLLNEGVSEGMIKVTGNTVIDALYYVADRPEPEELVRLIPRVPSGSRLILVTAHRRENFGRPIEAICQGLKILAARGDVEIVYPVHLNPNIQEPVYRLLRDVDHITLLPPLDYLPLVHLMKKSTIILTDSGGIQDEAPAFGIPTLVLREVTERPEGIEAGTLRLVGTDTYRIVQTTTLLLEDESVYARMSRAANPFGDGHASERIIQHLLDHPA